MSYETGEDPGKLVTRSGWIWISVTVLLGLLLLLASALLDDSGLWADAGRQWWSNALMNVGATLILFGPLLVLTESLTKRVRGLGRRVNKTQIDVAGAEQELQNVREAITPEIQSETAANMDDAVREKLAQGRREEEQIFLEMSISPSPRSISRALRLARRLELISSAWPRCELFYTAAHIRFIPDSTDEDAVELRAEADTGEVVAAIRWEGNETATDAFTRLGASLEPTYLWDGADKYFPGQLPKQLSELLMYASAHRRPVTGETNLNNLIEILESGWIIGDAGIMPKSLNYYVVAPNRLGEMDWEQHLRNKGWPEAHAAGQALKIARAFWPPKPAK